MPFIYCYTNLPNDQVPEDFEEWMTNLIHEVLNKSIERITVMVTPCMRMMKHGDKSPVMLVQMHSIGVFDEERNPGYTEQFKEKISEKIKLPPNRVTLHYMPVLPIMVAL